MAIRHIGITKMELFNKQSISYSCLSDFKRLWVYHSSGDCGNIDGIIVVNNCHIYSSSVLLLQGTPMSLVSVKEMAGVSFLSYNTVYLRFWRMQYRLCRTRKDWLSTNIFLLLSICCATFVAVSDFASNMYHGYHGMRDFLPASHQVILARTLTGVRSPLSTVKLEIASLDMPLEQPPRETRTPRVLSGAIRLIMLLPRATTWSNCLTDPKVEVRPSFPGPTVDGTVY